MLRYANTAHHAHPLRFPMPDRPVYGRETKNQSFLQYISSLVLLPAGVIAAIIAIAVIVVTPIALLMGFPL